MPYISKLQTILKDIDISLDPLTYKKSFVKKCKNKNKSHTLKNKSVKLDKL